jgi:two-component system catabolic regulation response regulator CreB/two-component system response regulator ChvI
MHNSKMSSFSDEESYFGNSILHQASKQAKQQQPQQQEEKKLSPFTKRILIVDDDPDITFTFKAAFEEANRSENKIFFYVNTYNDPLMALSEFKPDLYDLMLIDINMPEMNGFDFCVKVFEIDVNPRICFMSSALVNQEALKEQYPLMSIGCFIRKPVTIENLIGRVKAELE